MKLDTVNRVNSSQLEKLLSASLETRWAMPDDRLPAVMIWGPPGAGKSAIVRSVAESHHCRFIDLRLAQMEAIDVKGLPVPEKDGVHWQISSAYPRAPESKGILFLDELSACDRTIQTAAYELILDRKLGDDYRLPDNWLIVAAGNRIEDSASAVAMSSALANRFLHVEIGYDARSWHKWALAHGVHGAVTGLLNLKPALLADINEETQNLERGFPTPRSWERAGMMLERFGELDDTILRIAVCGLVGNSAGLELISFFHLYDEMEKVIALLLDPSAKISIPQDIAKRYAFCSALIKMLWNKEIGTDDARLDGFYRISQSLPCDFAAMVMRDAMTANPDGPDGNMKLIGHPAYSQWLEKHGSSLRGKRS